MTLAEATTGIGQRFKVMIPGVKQDIIRSVDDDGYIHGDFVTAHHTDCRFIGEQPAHLKAIVGEPDTPETIKRLASDTGLFDQIIESARQIGNVFTYPVDLLATSHTFIPKQKDE
jgi:hypothetical protein